ncbi:hypothetical protein MPTK1_4g04950 [Marchantia polymorpha subsp. ruderalis]|uniref:Major facilitator superfamily (MFS) profile domain-containing protein n=2 Tax=Marchantia polymorpha TaxID=3197 RepID=A0A176W1K5_MARPO|nr:hypothetical protein AXG93_4413s1280 [Marchantia polymorpha subsp. ruderalis]PTQ28999.1 hypothetical protein MARPO_0150s0019 [Marchantia polymorpha]BBN07607.1 hypothetical protein Mp_4g04950 [Marchantia polymorpha subsp. ruderalis]|eukprot:PTQ28999.1 hypothetical protein MARPO_0150s0019 [Marchantia polymorpha]
MAYAARGSVASERLKAVWPLAPLLFSLFLHVAAYSSALPSVIDVLVGAFCNGQNECSEVIFLAGLQTVFTGIGAIFVAPLLGSLSDDYGRKPVILLVMSGSIVPAIILAYSRESTYVYIWWGLNCISGMLREAGLLSITFAFVADVVPEARQRAPAIGIAMSSISIGLLVGTLLARVISTLQVFKLSAVLHIVTVVILKLFVVESHPRHTTQPTSDVDSEKLVSLMPKTNTTSMLRETILAVRSSKLLRTVAAVAFMVHVAEAIFSSTLLYYLKAEFGFGKDEFAQFMVLMGIASIISQMLVYPVLAHFIGERGVLWVGLLGSAVNCYLYAFAWAEWVLYFSCSLGIIFALVPAAIGTIVSRGADPEQQGKVQGLVVSVKTVASVIGPIAVTPLTAAFLSDNPPFNCPGFTLIIGGTAVVVALLISLTLPRLPMPDTCFHTTNPTPTSDYVTVTTSDDGEAENEKERQVLVEP